MNSFVDTPCCSRLIRRTYRKYHQSIFSMLFRTTGAQTTTDCALVLSLDLRTVEVDAGDRDLRVLDDSLAAFGCDNVRPLLLDLFGQQRRDV